SLVRDGPVRYLGTGWRGEWSGDWVSQKLGKWGLRLRSLLRRCHGATLSRHLRKRLPNQEHALPRLCGALRSHQRDCGNWTRRRDGNLAVLEWICMVFADPGLRFHQWHCQYGCGAVHTAPQLGPECGQPLSLKILGAAGDRRGQDRTAAVAGIWR